MVAPFGAAVFLARALVPARGKIYPNPHTIGGDKKENSFHTVPAPLYMKRIVQRRCEVAHDFRQAARYGGGDEERRPHHPDYAKRGEDIVIPGR